jgi:ATP-dependent DNA helicase PIF1
VLYLTENIRLRGVTSSDNLRYAEYLSRLSYTPELYGAIALPSYIQVYQDYDRFYTTLFPPGVITMARETPKIFADRVILTSHNTSVAELNSDVLKTINGDAQTFTSVDSAEQRSEDKAFYMNDEYFHTLKASGIPSARLMLKISAPVMLIRNMNPAKGFCNGTRYIVKRIHSRVIKVEISSGEFKGRCITLPRILCNSKKSDFRFILTRR